MIVAMISIFGKEEEMEGGGGGGEEEGETDV